MLVLLLILISIAIWIGPWYAKAKPDKTVQKKMWIGFVLCMFVGTILSLLLTSQIGRLFGLFSDGFAYMVLDDLEVALVEEAVKCFLAVRVCRKLQQARTIDYVLIFGMTGAGFELFESFLSGTFGGSSSILVLIIRGVFAGHIFYLFLSGFGYAAYKAGDRHAFARNFAIAVLLHFTFDLGANMMGDTSLGDVLTVLSVVVELFAIVSSVWLIVWAELKLKKACAPAK